MPTILYDEQGIMAELEKDICPIHKKHAQITISNKGFKISSCCDEFGEFLEIKAHILMGYDAHNFVIKLSKDSLKE